MKNWHKMLWRLWIVASVPWIFVIGVGAVNADRNGMLFFGLVGLLPPLVVLAIDGLGVVRP